MKPNYPVLAFAMSGTLSVASQAGELKLSVELPQLKVVEYHRPYVAMWIEKADQSFASNLAVWYDIKQENKKGNEWLKDMRQWWRKSGRQLNMPVDGLSGATRAPGTHELTFNSAKSPLKDLPPGEYRLVVEAAREVGGRELVGVPFQWPAKSPAAQKGEANGSHELGAVKLEVKP